MQVTIYLHLYPSYDTMTPGFMLRFVFSAFGGLVCLLPEYKHLSKEMALADSITTDGKSLYIALFILFLLKYN
jgi:hypothetical protein